MAENMDFHKAGIVHLLWKKRLKGFLDGKETITKAEVISPKECELGKWIYTEGLSKYKDMPEMIELEKVHIEIHMIINKVLQLKNSNDNLAAEKEFQRLEPLSKKIVHLLTALGMKV